MFMVGNVFSAFKKVFMMSTSFLRHHYLKEKPGKLSKFTRLRAGDWRLKVLKPNIVILAILRYYEINNIDYPGMYCV